MTVKTIITPETDSAAREQPEAAGSLPAASGDLFAPFTRRRDTDDAPVEFFPRMPKLSALPTMLHYLSQDADDNTSRLALLPELLACFLYVHDEPTGYKRRATSEELGSCLEFTDLERLNALAEQCLKLTFLTTV